MLDFFPRRLRSCRRPVRLAFFLFVLFAGCARQPAAPPAPVPPSPPAAYAPLGEAEALAHAREMTPASQGMASWRDLAPGLEASLAYVSAKPQSSIAFSRPGYRISWAALRLTLEDLVAALPYLDEDPGVLARAFTWFPLEPNTLVTGYYEPFLQASLTPAPGYPYPVYGVPHDLLRVDLGEFRRRWKGRKLYYRLTKHGIEPYYSREDIDFRGALAGKGDAIAWVKDRVELYFLQIQGSGRLVLPDGSIKHVLYADKNGRDLTMLGGTMVRRGYLTRQTASMTAIRNFMLQHPELERGLLSTDTSYVFFRLADEGPYGSMGKLLTPMSSIAVDRRSVPLGAALAMSVPLPRPKVGGPAELAGVALAQDAGGAIVGNHVDLFCGSGEYAEYVSGRMKNDGSLYVLVSKRALRAAEPPATPSGEEEPEPAARTGR